MALPLPSVVPMISTNLPSITYHCTATRSCKHSTTTFEAWVSHELTIHRTTDHNNWLCHATSSIPECTCNLAFRARTDFQAHWYLVHPKDEVGNWRAIRHDDYLLGPEADRLFWCGFCKKVFSCNMTRTWAVDRFEHIAAHFQVDHPTWDHFEIKNWQYLKFWVAPAPVLKDPMSADEGVNTDRVVKTQKKDGDETDKITKPSQRAKESSAGKLGTQI